MRIDASEIKAFRDCPRKHTYSSRNRYHLQPCTPNDNLIFGTQFHELLASMYLGTPLDRLLETITREVTDDTLYRTMCNMIIGYYNGPYKKDKNRYVVVDIEKSFNYPVAATNADFDVVGYKLVDNNWLAYNSVGETCDCICACGSIDMVCIDAESGKLVAFEHKSAKNFRPDVYNYLDEQPRLYTWALEQILNDYHAHDKYQEITECGPVYLNQVKKLLTRFEYVRSECTYTREDMSMFMKAFVDSCRQIATPTIEGLPQPSYMKCQMCDYANLCMHYGYHQPQLPELLQEFDGEYVVRDHDHLDEKAERHVGDN